MKIKKWLSTFAAAAIGALAVAGAQIVAAETF